MVNHANASPPDSNFSGMLGTPEDPSSAELMRAKAMVFQEMFPRDEGARIDDRYTLSASIGAGGIGRVYRARDSKLDRDVAMKFLRRITAGSPSADALVREAKVLARLQHPNIVAVYDVGRADDELYLTMELVAGQSLQRWLAETRRRWDDVLPLFLQAGMGLEAAHAEGVVHRDFKPSNVMVGDDGRVRVVDFGLARELTASSKESSASDSDSERTTAAGTHHYMAPEQFAGLPTAASDQFGFCTSLFEAVTGVRPWEGEVRGICSSETAAALAAHLRAASVPAWLRAALARGLQRNPVDRFTSMGELLEALRPPRRTGRVVLAAAMLATLGGWALGGEPDPCENRGAAASEVWSSARRDAFEALAADDRGRSGLLVAPLDQYAEAWNDQDGSTCRARASGEISGALHDLRQRCLVRSLDKVDYLLNELEDADPIGSRLAEDATLVAVDLGECKADERLLTGQPSADYDAATGDRILKKLGRAYVQQTLGESEKFYELLIEAKASLPKPSRNLPEELLLEKHLGAALNGRARYEEAEDILMAALLRAESERGWAVDTSGLRVQLSTAVLHQPGRAGEALLLAQLAAASAKASAGEGRYELPANTAVAAAALALGDTQLASDATRAALEIAKARDSSGIGRWSSFRLNYAEALAQRAATLAALGKSAEAAQSYEAALGQLERTGHNGPVKAVTLNNLAPLIRPTDPARAIDLLRQAAELKRDLGLPTAAGSTYMNLGNAYLREGNYPEANAAYTEAEGLISDDASAERAKLFYNRGLARQETGELSRASADFEAVLKLASSLQLSDGQPLVYSTLLALAQIRLQEDEPDRATELLHRAKGAEVATLQPALRAELRLALSQSLATTDAKRAKVEAAEGLELLRDSPDSHLFAQLSERAGRRGAR